MSNSTIRCIKVLCAAAAISVISGCAGAQKIVNSEGIAAERIIISRVCDFDRSEMSVRISAIQNSLIEELAQGYLAQNPPEPKIRKVVISVSGIYFVEKWAPDNTKGKLHLYLDGYGISKKFGMNTIPSDYAGKGSEGYEDTETFNTFGYGRASPKNLDKLHTSVIKSQVRQAAMMSTQRNYLMLQKLQVTMKRKGTGWDMVNQMLSGGFSMGGSRMTQIIYFGKRGESAVMKYVYQVDVKKIISRSGAYIVR